MIKLHSSGLAPDYTEYGRVTTDCNTVGEFMTEAASIYGGELTIKVDGCQYEFLDNTKIKVADDTPIDEVTYASVSGRMKFIVKTKPKPKTVKKSGFANICRSLKGEYIPIGKVYGKKDECDQDHTRKEIILNANFVAVAKIEWEEAI